MNAPEITRVQIKEAGFTPTSPKIGGWLIVVAIGLILSLLQNFTFMLPALAPLGGGPTWVRLTDPKSPAFHPYWRSIGLVAMLTIESASVLVRADAEEKIRKELKANYAEIVKGFKKSDPTIWEGFLIPEFKLKLFNGSVQDRQWVVGYVRNNARTFKVLKLSMVIKELKIEGEDATAVVEQKSSRTFNDDQGNAHRLDVGALQREIWTKTPNGWRLKSVEEWKILYLLKDGKP